MLIRPYKLGSRSARNLQAELASRGIRLLRTVRDIDRRDVLNWGTAGQLANTINSGAAISIAHSKINTLRALNGLSTVEWTDDSAVAKQWYDEGNRVYCRTIDNGHSGNGIVVAGKDLGQEIVRAVVYTKYAKNKHEYRIHVFDGKVIYAQKKRRSNERADANVLVRNHANGWVFCTENVTVPEVVSEQAIKAVQQLGLVFGAVDIGYRERDQMPFIFEVNTAPGIEGTTVTKYADAIILYATSKGIDLNRTFAKKRKVR